MVGTESERGQGAEAEKGWMALNSQRRETADHSGWEDVRELSGLQGQRLRVPAPEAVLGAVTPEDAALSLAYCSLRC